MKQKRLTLAILTIALTSTLTTGLSAQVTIGSTTPPRAGALLDLTQGATTTKGLGMPRVMLTDKDKLYPMLPGGYSPTEDAKHIGLMVFHSDKCTMDGKGLYVWNGAKWNKIGEIRGALELNPNYIDFPSGQDARTLEAHALTVKWPKSPSPATWSLDPAGALPHVPFSSNPIPTLTNSPQVISLLPDAMTTAEITANRWASKRSEYTFTELECGQTEKLVVEQVNHAIYLRNFFPTFTGTMPVTSATAPQLGIQSNVDWAAVVTASSGAFAASSLTPASGLSESRDGSAPTLILIAANMPITGGKRYDYADITFMDQHNPKRAKDISVSYVNCTAEPVTLNEWAVRAGFTTAQVNSISATGGTHGLTQANGIQLHKDQSGNVFLSGDFGTAGRWMLNNLSATKYDSYVTHAHGRVIENYPNGITPTPPAAAYWSYVHYYSNTPNYNRPPSWYYPYFNRLGAHYTWDTATAGKGGATDADPISGEWEISATPDTDPQTIRVQGICPNGWHLPSDWEWTQLEIEMNDHASKYSRTEDTPDLVSVGQVGQGSGWRGAHGRVMMDPCPILCGSRLLNSDPTIGKSNAIGTTVAPGMNLLLGGGINIIGYGTSFWASSGSGTYAMTRNFGYNSPAVQREALNRSHLFTVRCKKN